MLYPANSSSPPSPDNATVTCVRARRETMNVGICDGSANGSSYSSGSRGIQTVFGGDVELGVFGAEMPGDGRGMRRFVILGLVEADAERLHRPRAHRLHQGHDRRRINAAREQRAQADVGDHPP